jgi:hypothetical protein
VYTTVFSLGKVAAERAITDPADVQMETVTVHAIGAAKYREANLVGSFGRVCDVRSTACLPVFSSATSLHILQGAPADPKPTPPHAPCSAGNLDGTRVSDKCWRGVQLVALDPRLASLKKVSIVLVGPKLPDDEPPTIPSPSASGCETDIQMYTGAPCGPRPRPE